MRREACRGREVIFPHPNAGGVGFCWNLAHILYIAIGTQRMQGFVQPQWSGKLSLTGFN